VTGTVVAGATAARIGACVVAGAVAAVVLGGGGGGLVVVVVGGRVVDVVAKGTARRRDGVFSG
jgi:galactokinase/mevalonate kinase-like predicted kinase